MNKCICDVCRTNPATDHFKVKKIKYFGPVPGFGIAEPKWIKIDICNCCYNQLIEISKKG